MIAEFGLHVSNEAFLSEFLYWPRQTYPGTQALLTDLSRQYTLASLSTISEMHWNRISTEMDLVAYFGSNFPSFQTGYVKPDREAYLHALNTLDCKPEKVLFMDDNRANVETARSLGMAAFTVDGLTGVEDILKRKSVY